MLQVRFLARSRNDHFIGYNNPAAAASTYAADILLVDKAWLKWESAALFSSERQHFGSFSFACAWPMISDTSLLERALSMCQISWDISETQAELTSMCSCYSYSVEKDGREVSLGT